MQADQHISLLSNCKQLVGSIRSGLIDMMLLSECDEIVMTGSSTFGSVAAGWGGIAPVVMLPGHHMDIDVSHSLSQKLHFIRQSQ